MPSSARHAVLVVGDAPSGALSASERAEAERGHPAREDQPASVFLEPGTRKYPVKTRRNGAWHYDRDLLLAAAREARMHGHSDLAARADEIRHREFPQAADVLALDLSPSTRRHDEDGHLHVSDAPISKATINPYIGREIPGYQELGLDPDRIYKLLRDPEELARAAPTFSGKPLLSVHKPQTAEDHSHALTVGSVGDIYWDAPYLRAKDLHVWDADSIAGIESGEQKQLSSAYRYDPVMEAGTHNGERYDGRMTNIRGNHVALVPRGRAGADVVIGDALPSQLIKEPDAMPAAKPILSRKAALAKGALSLHLRPKLAQDAVLDLNAILAGVTAKNYKSQTPKIMDRLRAATKDKLAQDADLDDVVSLLDAMSDVDAGPDDDVKLSAVKDPSQPGEDPEGTQDGPDGEAIRDYLKGKVSPEDHAKICEMLGVEPDSAPARDEGGTMPGKPAEGKPAAAEPVTKTAMDAAIAVAASKAAAAAETATIARLRAVREAEAVIRPYVGELSVALDSAEDVYRFALDAVGVDHKDVKELPALRLILTSQPVPGQERRSSPGLALDSAAEKSYAERFPNANRLAS